MTDSTANRLAVLAELREAAGLTQDEMAAAIGLSGSTRRQTAGQWELGGQVPHEPRRRLRFMGYLWDDLGLRRDPARFEEVWTILVEAWGWMPLGDAEWAALTTTPRPSQAEPNKPARPAPFLPPNVTEHFVGREEERRIVETALLDGETVALVGMGGVGKSTLAIRTAHRLRAEFPDGVLWGQCRVSSALDILGSWAQVYGHDYRGLADVESRAAAVRNLLAGKRVLLLLDDVEPSTPVAALLAGGPAGAALLTTRNEEVAQRYGATPLRLAGFDPATSLGLLGTLLGQDRVAREPEAAREICALLHHFPLAVEMAAQLLRVRTRRQLAQMADRLRDAQGRLSLGIADRDVRTSFLVSWDALTPDLHRVFAALGLFAGRSFTAVALAAVLDEPENTVLEWVDALVALSLLGIEGADRYRQHPLLADFAAEQMGDAPELWRAYVRSQLAFVQAAAADPDRIEPEWENLMAAMHAADAQAEPRAVMEFADLLGHVWHRRAQYTRAREGYGLAAAAARQLGDAAAEAQYLCEQGNVCVDHDDLRHADEILTRAASLTKPETRTAGRVRYLLGRTAFERGEYVRAARLLAESESILLRVEEGVDLALVAFYQAHIYYERGQMAIAEKNARYALAIQQSEHVDVDAIGTLRLLADIMIEGDDLAQAETFCRRALAKCQATGNQAEHAATLYTAAVVKRKLSQLDAAAALLAQAADLLEPLGLQFMQAVVRMEEARIHFMQKRFEPARHAIAVTVKLLRTLGRPFNLVYALDLAGEIAMARGEVADGIASFQAARQLSANGEHPHHAVVTEHLAGAQRRAEGFSATSIHAP